MDEISSFVEKIKFVFIVKKMILICQNIISTLWDVKKKKVLWWQKFRYVLLHIKKSDFWWQKFIYVLLYILKEDFLRRKLHS